MGTFIPDYGYRMAWDVDGSIGYWSYTGGSGVDQASPAQMALWNAEWVQSWWNNVGNNNEYWFGIIFPELRDISAFYIYHWYDSIAPNSLQVSSDTTNGIDGTWVQMLNSWPYSGQNNGQQYSYPGYWRAYQQPLNATGVKAIRYAADQNIGVFHVFGQASVGQNPDRLEFWDPINNTELLSGALDLGNGGDVTQGQTYSGTFRINNLSATKTATNIKVNLEILADVNPSLIPMYMFSIDSSPFAESIIIPSLAPGSISDVITVQFNVSNSAEIYPTSPRIAAIPQTYS